MTGGYVRQRCHDRHRTETLLLRRSDGIPNDIARLRGARYVSAIESEENRRLAESRIKSLTGGDTITARFMRVDNTRWIRKPTTYRSMGDAPTASMWATR